MLISSNGNGHEKPEQGIGHKHIGRTFTEEYREVVRMSLMEAEQAQVHWRAHLRERIEQDRIVVELVKGSLFIEERWKTSPNGPYQFPQSF